LLAAAQRRPADALLFVLCVRQGQRQQKDVTLVGQPAGAVGQLLGPERVVVKQFGQVRVGAAAPQAGEQPH